VNIKEAFEDKFQKKVGIAICFCLGLFFLYEHFANPEITQEKELTTLDVIVEDYIFERHEDNSRRYPTYYIKTLQYQNIFTVASDDLWLFQMDQFESDSLKNKPIKIKISNKEKADLNQPDEIISLYEISETNNSYLSSKETLRENQGFKSLMITFVFFGLGGFLTILLKKKL
jgi:mRNA-degrading endonuclease HigB of HigAB toxin-antitoxin module